jgi:hypothetical protein
MARERSEQPRPLGAAIVPVQRALIARAKAIEAEMVQLAERPSGVPAIETVILHRVAAEFRALADELGHW